jgi:uncharacterized UBP type Zn finger protein
MLPRRVEGLARETAASARAARQYTDTKGFQLKCLVCGVGALAGPHWCAVLCSGVQCCAMQVLIKGDAEATKHAKDTKHTNFSEV